jgi:hypothetical protein
VPALDDDALEIVYDALFAPEMLLPFLRHW